MERVVVGDETLEIRHLVPLRAVREEASRLAPPGDASGTPDAQGYRQGSLSCDCVRVVYECRSCRRRFDDLTGTVFANHHQPLRVWITRLYLMGLDLSGLQIARELGIDQGDARAMIATLRQGIVDRTPPEGLSVEAECDEVDVAAGHKGHPEAVKKKAESADDDA